MIRSVTLRRMLLATGLAAWGGVLSAAQAVELPETRLKAAFLYNFALFTEWPPETGPTLTLCLIDSEALRAGLEEFKGQPVGSRRFEIRRVPDAESSQGCQMIFLPRASEAALARSLHALEGRRALLTVGDSPEADQAGVGINLVLKDAHVTFDVNLKSVQGTGLNLSSKLLRLAQHVR